MAVLLVELHGTRRGSVLPHRVLIGRRPMNHLVIEHTAVSRLHAWIDGEGDRYYISDVGSRTGTRVNGQRVIARHLLGDGDEITIGPAKLTFLAEPRVRPGVEVFDLSAVPPAPATDAGILFDCPSCNAPLWAGKDFAGRTGQCKYCGHDLAVPGLSSADAAPTAPAAAATEFSAPTAPAEKVRTVAQICGVCQSSISTFEEQTACPSCGLVFHAECWAENYGCSAYGCSQVNALMPPEAAEAHARPFDPTAPGGSGTGAAAAAAEAAGEFSAAGASAGTAERFPWEFLLLAGSVFAALLGALTFGLPSLALAGGSVAYMARTRRGGATTPHRGIVLLSAGLAVLGMFTGAAVSYFLYFGSAHS